MYLNLIINNKRYTRMNLEVNRDRADEIVFSQDSTMIMQKVNAQIVEFNP